MKKIKFAIYGCGVIAGFHVAAIKEIPSAELYACADFYKPAAERFAMQHGIKLHSGFDALLDDIEVDVICVCTPSGTHASLAISALEHNKNVVLEKPMATSVLDCDRIIEAASKSKAKITVISQLRTSPDVIRARELVKSGAIGKIVLSELVMKYYRGPEYFKGSWRGTKAMDGGGALMNQGIHGVDLLQYIVGPIKNTQSIVRTLLHDIEVEDTAVASVEFENSALGVIVASTATHPGFERRIQINGTRGAIDIIEDKIVRLVIDGKDEINAKFDGISGSSSNTSISHKGHINQISTFIDVLSGKSCEYVDENEGKKAVEIIENIYKKTI